jgi:hypothetical protein
VKQNINQKINNCLFEKNTELHNKYNDYHTITDFYYKENNSNIYYNLDNNYAILGMKNEKKLFKLNRLFENIFRNHFKNFIIEQKYKYMINKYKFYSMILFTSLAFVLLIFNHHTTGCCINYSM